MASIFENMGKTSGKKRQKTLTKDTCAALKPTLCGLVELCNFLSTTQVFIWSLEENILLEAKMSLYHITGYFTRHDVVYERIMFDTTTFYYCFIDIVFLHNFQFRTRKSFQKFTGKYPRDFRNSSVPYEATSRISSWRSIVGTNCLCHKIRLFKVSPLKNWKAIGNVSKWIVGLTRLLGLHIQIAMPWMHDRVYRSDLNWHLSWMFRPEIQTYNRPRGWYHGDRISGPLKFFRTSQQYSTEVFKGGLHSRPDYAQRRELLEDQKKKLPVSRRAQMMAKRAATKEGRTRLGDNDPLISGTEGSAILFQLLNKVATCGNKVARYGNKVARYGNKVARYRELYLTDIIYIYQGFK